MLKNCIDWDMVLEKSCIGNNYNIENKYVIDDECCVKNGSGGLELHLVIGWNNGEPENSPNYEYSNRTFILDIDLDEVV